ncbi:MAG: hypothetical protein HY457_03200 [Parcubacteria group bacterium]|nr:hypothetical protein [Parcubacteria group bacterium]
MRRSTNNLRRQAGGGYTLLLAVLLSSILLAVALGLLSIIEKGITLSAAGRDSQFAFYAADGGGECALLWDIRFPGFGESVFATSTLSSPPSSGVLCNGQDIASSWTIYDQTVTSAKTSFRLTLTNDACATVLVEKEASGSVTQITTSGFNTCDETYPRRVERTIRITY